MKVIVGIALAAALSVASGQAFAESDDRPLTPAERQHANYYGRLAALAHFFGACERHFDKASADQMLLTITGAGVKERSEFLDMLTVIWSRSYAEGRGDRRFSTLDADQCSELIEDAAAEAEGLRRALPPLGSPPQGN